MPTPRSVQRSDNRQDKALRAQERLRVACAKALADIEVLLQDNNRQARHPLVGIMATWLKVCEDILGEAVGQPVATKQGDA